MEGRVISKIRQITAKRAKLIKIRLSNFTPEDLFKVIDKAAISDFLNGRIGTRGWIANFDWIFGNESNFIKVLEGRYDNVSPSLTEQSLFPTITDNNNLNNYNNGTQQQFYGVQSTFTNESERRILETGARGFNRAYQNAMRDIEQKYEQQNGVDGDTEQI